MRCFMAMQPARQYIAIEQYLLLVNNCDRRFEYYNGEVRLMAGGTSNHATIALNCGVALDHALGEDAVCRLYVTDKLVRVAPTKILIPDVVVSCDTADHGGNPKSSIRLFSSSRSSHGHMNAECDSSVSMKSTFVMSS